MIKLGNLRRRQYRADTIVEVMLAMAVIGMVIGTAYTISNRATQLSRLAQQRTQVNNLMRAQAEMIKLYRDGDPAGKWDDIASGYATGSSAPAGKISCSSKISDYSSGNQPFYVGGHGNIRAYPGDDPSKSTAAGVDGTGQYQIFTVPFRSSGYIDFYVVGCWQGPGSYGVQQSFIVERLNTP